MLLTKKIVGIFKNTPFQKKDFCGIFVGWNDVFSTEVDPLVLKLKMFPVLLDSWYVTKTIFWEA